MEEVLRNPLAYLLTTFQIHQAITAITTQGSSALSSTKATNTTRAETAVRLVMALASSVMKRQRGTRGIRVSRDVGTQETLLVRGAQGEGASPEGVLISGIQGGTEAQIGLTPLGQHQHRRGGRG